MYAIRIIFSMSTVTASDTDGRSTSVTNDGSGGSVKTGQKKRKPEASTIEDPIENSSYAVAAFQNEVLRIQT